MGGAGKRAADGGCGAQLLPARHRPRRHGAAAHLQPAHAHHPQHLPVLPQGAAITALCAYSPTAMTLLASQEAICQKLTACAHQLRIDHCTPAESILLYNTSMRVPCSCLHSAPRVHGRTRGSTVSELHGQCRTPTRGSAWTWSGRGGRGSCMGPSWCGGRTSTWSADAPRRRATPRPSTTPSRTPTPTTTGLCSRSQLHPQSNDLHSHASLAATFRPAPCSSRPRPFPACLFHSHGWV